MTTTMNSPVLVRHSSPILSFSPRSAIDPLLPPPTALMDLRSPPPSSPTNASSPTLPLPERQSIQDVVAEFSSSQPEPPPESEAVSTRIAPELEAGAESAAGAETDTATSRIENSAQVPQNASSAVELPVDTPPTAAAARDDMTTSSAAGEDSGAVSGPPTEAGMSTPRPASLPRIQIPLPPPVEDTTAPIPEWIVLEEDTSVPDGEELKEIEEGTEESALDSNAQEKHIFDDLDDPEQRPTKKIRLSWNLKGFRGTKEKPNYARVLNSPAALVDGFYWYIKLYPRGNNSASLSAYINCSRNPPTPEPPTLESTFFFVEGPPDANLADLPPQGFQSIPVTDLSSAPPPPPPPPLPPPPADDVDLPPDGAAAPIRLSDWTEDDMDTLDLDSEEILDDWRISAQIGLVVYNPAEPRTHVGGGLEHQFSRHIGDWGWTNFHSPWADMHKRKRGQRQPLLRNDTISVDAYIRVFDDPTKALWWHQSESESQWDSKSLTGYFPMGTPPLYHSPGVAGTTALLLLAPFRKILQDVDTSTWRRDPLAKPQPFISQLKIVLFLMRKMRKSERYVNVNPLLEALALRGETWYDVWSFWEVFKRTIVLELEGNPTALEQLEDIFGPLLHDSNIHSHLGAQPLQIPVDSVVDVQRGIEKALGAGHAKQQLPKFLPVGLNRQQFDEKRREWNLLHRRVRLNETLDLSQWASEHSPSQYTLYGFLLHVGSLSSGKYYSVLRPNGPGTKWLAFEDGDGNKVFSYTQQRIESFEGLEGDELKHCKSTRQNAYIAMYIRTDCVNDFLPGALEPYRLEGWIKPQIWTTYHGTEADFVPEVPAPKTDTISVEVYSSGSAIGRTGRLDMFDVKDIPDRDKHVFAMQVSSTATFTELRQDLAAAKGINPHRIRLWLMNFGPLGQYFGAGFERVTLDALVTAHDVPMTPLPLWMAVLESKDDYRDFQEFWRPRSAEPAALPPSADPSAATAAADTSAPPAPAPTNAPADSSSTAPDDNDHDDPADAIHQLFIEAAWMPPPVEASGRVVVDHLPAAASLSNPSPAVAASADSIGVSAAPNRAGDEAEAAPDAVQQSVADAVAASVANAGTVVAEDAQTVAPDAGPPLAADAIDPVPDEAETATPDAVQQSVADAVAASVASVASASTVADTEPRAVAEETSLQLPLPMQAAGSTAPTPQTEHAVPDDGQSGPLNREAEPASRNLTFEDMGTSDESPAPPEDLTSSSRTAAIGSAPRTAGDELATLSRSESVLSEDADVIVSIPKAHVYGFIISFDVEIQTFTVLRDFFAPVSASIRATVSRLLPVRYPADGDFSVWRAHTSTSVPIVGASTTFADINFSDGVDVIVGPTLTDAQRLAYLQRGQFADPASLTQQLNMTARRHPLHTYSGELVMSGMGVVAYRGPVVHGRRHGAVGALVASNGDAYTGPFVSGVKSGAAGNMIFANGDKYTGDWLDDEAHGQGTLIEARTRNTYTGGWLAGKKWGKGVTHWEVAEEEADLCQICYGGRCDALFFDCGHVVACVECAERCSADGNGCPICRRGIVRVVRIFRA